MRSRCASPTSWRAACFGNVKEWVADGYARTYYIDSPPVDPKGPSSAIEHVIRGGSYVSDAGSATIHHRYGRAPSFQSDELGFRCAASLPR